MFMFPRVLPVHLRVLVKAPVLVCVDPCLWSTGTASPLVSTDLQAGAAPAAAGLEQLLGLRALQPHNSPLMDPEEEIAWVLKDPPNSAIPLAPI